MGHVPPCSYKTSGYHSDQGTKNKKRARGASSSQTQATVKYTASPTSFTPSLAGPLKHVRLSPFLPPLLPPILRFSSQRYAAKSNPRTCCAAPRQATPCGPGAGTNPVAFPLCMCRRTITCTPATENISRTAPTRRTSHPRETHRRVVGVGRVLPASSLTSKPIRRGTGGGTAVCRRPS